MNMYRNGDVMSGCGNYAAGKNKYCWPVSTEATREQIKPRNIRLLNINIITIDATDNTLCHKKLPTFWWLQFSQTFSDFQNAESFLRHSID